MKSFDYTIKDPNGVHARPAGMLVKEASKFLSDITIHLNNKEADAKKIFAVMSMNIKSGDTVCININGEDEEKALGAMEKFLKSNL